MGARPQGTLWGWGVTGSVWNVFVGNKALPVPMLMV